MHRQLAYNALKEGKSLNQYINEGLEQFVANTATGFSQKQ
ncbi:toxin-antitoxin system HicB family antitoxin [Succiniclasticum sp.]